MRSVKLVISATCLAAVCLLYSCKKDQTQAVNFEYDYFPIDTGHYVIYEADSITYNDFTTPVITVNTSKFYIKEVIQSNFTDNTGATTCWIAGYRSSSPNGPWSNYYSWTANRTRVNAQKTENNLRYTKLAFPPTATTTWAGNSYINCIDNNAYLDNWLYSYQNINVPLTLTAADTTLSFGSTLSVLQIADSTLISKTYSVEKYAENVGLVYKELDSLAIDSGGTNNKPWPRKANAGFIYRLTAISYKQ